MTDRILEALASLEHRQWVEWSKSLAKSEKLSGERLARWQKLWVPYSKLSDEAKEQDRVYARKALKIFKRLDA